MLIFAMDTSGKTASAALLRDGTVEDTARQDSVLDHSRVLLPMCRALLEKHGLTFSDPDVFAVVNGPGSFTGIRIATAAAKGFAWSLDKPCAAVSSLLAMAYDVQTEGVLCARVHARADEYFYAFFRRENEAVIRLTEDAVDAEAIILKKMEELCCRTAVTDEQTAAGAAKAAWVAAQADALQSCHEINPSYLRITQAERMRKERMGE